MVENDTRPRKPCPLRGGLTSFLPPSSGGLSLRLCGDIFSFLKNFRHTTGYQTSKNIIQHGSDVLSRAYPAGSQVARIAMNTFYLKTIADADRLHHAIEISRAVGHNRACVVGHFSSILAAIFEPV